MKANDFITLQLLIDEKEKQHVKLDQASRKIDNFVTKNWEEIAHAIKTSYQLAFGVLNPEFDVCYIGFERKPYIVVAPDGLDKFGKIRCEFSKNGLCIDYTASFLHQAFINSVNKMLVGEK